MSSPLDVPYEMTTIVSFRLPISLHELMRGEAKKQLCSVSDIARQLVLAELRNRKLLD